MKSKTFHLILKLLIALAGAGAGVALVFAAVEIIKLANPSAEMNVVLLALACAGSALVFGLLLWFASDRVIGGVSSLFSLVTGKLDSMPVTSLLPAVSGLVVGLVIAALLCGILGFMGDSIFTAAISALLYLSLGTFGFTIGRRRAQELNTEVRSILGRNKKRYRSASGRRRFRHSRRLRDGMKVADVSSLTDGRLVEICRAGFLQGEITVPDSAVAELRSLSSSSDPARKARGERGLTILETLRSVPDVTLKILAAGQADDDPDVNLLRLIKETSGALITCDQSLARSAAVSGIRVLNINRLSEALRLSVSAGDVLEVNIVREGREAHQGVGYLSDGTMIVCENGASCIGQTVSVTVTSALQTSAGRMVFARLNALA